jgi:hypothetical protein
LENPTRGQKDPTVGAEGGKIECGGSRLEEQIQNHGHLP